MVSVTGSYTLHHRAVHSPPVAVKVKKSKSSSGSGGKKADKKVVNKLPFAPQ